MSTFQEIIERVNESRPNSFSDRQKLRWLAALEGRIAADVFLMDIAQIRELEPKWPEGLDRETLVGYPHDDIYDTWLIAKIDEANREYTEYQNSMEFYNEHYSAFVKWFARVYRPAQGSGDKLLPHDGAAVYYLTAYAIAVKRGFQGTVDEWLESLVGPKGAPGKSAYETALEGGFPGTEEEFNRKLVTSGMSAYEIAREEGFEGTPEEWLESLVPDVTPEQIGAAPAGYGLGNSSPKVISGVDALDSAMANGWYYVTDLNWASFGGVILNLALMLVVNKDNYHVRQILFVAGNNTVIRREKHGSDNDWTDWCCENPPMGLGVEYRTTERHSGLPVYIKRVSGGTMPASGYKDIVILASAKIIDFRLLLTSSSGMVYPQHTSCNPAVASGGTIRAYVSADMSAYTAEAVAKYVKT